MLDDDKRAIAYHEAGHAVAAHYLQPENRVLKASIIRAGDALGVVQRSPREERYTRHARQIETDIMISLGSRAVEEVILGTKMTGASHRTSRARRTWPCTYCSCFGMGSSLLVMPATQMGGMPDARSREMADALLDDLMEETKRLIAGEGVRGPRRRRRRSIEKGELIGTELEEVFEAADAAHPESAGPFERKIITLPRLFASPSIGGQDWPTADVETPAAFGQPGFGGAAGRPASDRPAPGTPGWPGTPGTPGSRRARRGSRRAHRAHRRMRVGRSIRAGSSPVRSSGEGAPTSRGPSRAGLWRISGPRPDGEALRARSDARTG